MWFAALLKLIPARDFFYGALIVGAALFAWHCYDKYTDAVDFARIVKAESKAVSEKAAQDMKDKDAAYVSAIKVMGDAYANALKNASAQHVADTGRLREFDAYRASHPLLGGAGGAEGQPGADRWISALTALEPVAAELADGLRLVRAQRDACVLDRDSLTGK